MQSASPPPWKLQNEATVPFLEVLIHNHMDPQPPKGPLPPCSLSGCQVFEQGMCTGHFQALRLLSETRVLGPSAQAGCGHRDCFGGMLLPWIIKSRVLEVEQ